MLFEMYKLVRMSILFAGKIYVKPIKRHILLGNNALKASPTKTFM